MSWKVFDPKNTENLVYDGNYLVSYKTTENGYSLPHKAYWDFEEQKFFSLETDHSHALYVDAYIEMPCLD